MYKREILDQLLNPIAFVSSPENAEGPNTRIVGVRIKFDDKFSLGDDIDTLKFILDHFKYTTGK